MTTLTVEELERWVKSGAQWRLVEVSSDRAVVELRACTGEAVERRESGDADLIAYVRTAPDGT